MPENSPRPLVLCVLDGWGHRDERDHNAIALAQTPVYDRLWKTCPHALLKTSAEEVGLPPGQMGNSEVGHTNIGAGRVVLQSLPRIDAAIADGSLRSIPVLAGACAAIRYTRLRHLTLRHGPHRLGHALHLAIRPSLT